MKKNKITKIIENSADIIGAADPTGKIIYMNKAGLEIFGWSEKDVENKNISDAHPEWMSRLILEKIFPLTQKTSFWKGESTIITIQKEEVPVTQIINAHYKKNNKIDFYSTIIRNMTDFKSFVKNMDETEKEYKELTENSVDIIWKTDLQLKFTYVSPSVQLLLDYTPHEVIKLGAEKTLTPDSYKKVLQIFHEELANEVKNPGLAGIRVFELDQVKKDGTIVNTEIISNFIRDNKGKIFAVSGRTRDITKRKRAERILENANQRLEEMVNIKTGELIRANRLLENQIKTNIQMAKKQSKLQQELARADKLKTLGMLAGKVAHDLNNTLSVTSGYSDILLNHISEFNSAGLNSENKKALKAVTSIKSASLKAASIIDDLLTLTRRNIFSKELININGIIKDLIISPEFQKIEKDNPAVTLNLNLQRNPVLIRGSETHIYKTFLNLLINSYESFEGLPESAVKSVALSSINLKSGDIKSDIILNFLKSKDNYTDNICMIKISDTGSGIKKNNIKKIFEPFYSTKKAGQSGTGLGMAIVYGTVQDHNGYIDVQSNIKKGTDFIIYFNSVIQDDKSSPEYDSVSDYKNSFDHKSIPEYENITDYKTINENLMGFNENILIIEDQKNQLDMTKTILESLNYTIKCAHNTQSAVSLVKKDLFDLIIFDMLLDNNETGLDCYKEILKINPQQKALIISGFSKTEKVKTAQKLGAGKFIRKPFTINIIAQAVKEELSK